MRPNLGCSKRSKVAFGVNEWLAWKLKVVDIHFLWYNYNFVILIRNMKGRRKTIYVIVKM